MREDRMIERAIESRQRQKEQGNGRTGENGKRQERGCTECEKKGVDAL